MPTIAASSTTGARGGRAVRRVSTARAVVVRGRGRGGDAGAGLELCRGAGRQRAAVDTDARCLERGAGRVRHHFARVLLAGRVAVRALADYLGHADPGFTLRVYPHLIPGEEDRAGLEVDQAWNPPS